MKMKQSIKYVLIINSILLILAILIISLVFFYNYKNSLIESSQISSSGDLLGGGIKGGFLYYFIFTLVIIFFYIFPLFVAIMSGLYQLKNPNLTGFFKSLLIPLSYATLTFVLLAIFWVLNSPGYNAGENTVALSVMIQLIATLLLVMIVNSIILFIIRKMKKDVVIGVKEFIQNKSKENIIKKVN